MVFGGLFLPAYLTLLAAYQDRVPFLQPPTSTLVAVLRVAACGLVVATAVLLGRPPHHRRLPGDRPPDRRTVTAP